MLFFFSASTVCVSFRGHRNVLVYLRLVLAPNDLYFCFFFFKFFCTIIFLSLYSIYPGCHDSMTFGRSFDHVQRDSQSAYASPVLCIHKPRSREQLWLNRNVFIFCPKDAQTRPTVKKYVNT